MHNFSSTNIEAYIKTAMQQWDIPGLAIAAIVNGQLVFQKGFGLRSVTDKLEINTKTVFRIGSVTKTFTTAALAILVSRNLLSWSDKVIDYLPEFRLYSEDLTNRVAIADLLSHNTGLPPFSSSFLAFLGFDSDYIMQKLALIEPSKPYGEAFQYKNGTYIVAAKIIEKIS